MQKINKKQVNQLVMSAVCLALCLTLPFLTGQIPQIGKALAPMHFPVLLAGFLCGPWWAMAVGLIAPPLRFLLFSAPPYPTFVAMAVELAVYGLVSGLLYRRLPKNAVGVYSSLIGAMLAGRVVWGLAMRVLMTAAGKGFPWSAFVAGAFVNAVPGIVLQLVVIPLLVLALQKAKLLKD